MAGTTSNQALPYPTSSDAPDGPAQMLALAQAVEKRLVQVFASVADRAARVPAPVEGMRGWLQDKNRYEFYTGTEWVPEAFGSLYKARQTVAQSVPHAAYTALTFTSEDIDDDDSHDTGVNTSRYTAPFSGWYQVAGVVCWAANTTGRRGTQWWVNGAALIGGSQALVQTISTGTATALIVAPTLLVELTAGDYVELRGYQDTGAALNTNISVGAQSAINVAWLRP